MSNISEFSSIAEVSFIENASLDQIKNKMIADYTAAYKDAAGVSPTISQSSPEIIMLNAFAAQFYQALQYMDNAGKMGLLKYSSGDYLDNLAALKGLTRNPATAARCKMKFTLSDIRSSATGIPGGTRVSAGSTYFATDEYMEIPAGSIDGTVDATALETGSASNELPAGEIDTIVDPVPYVAKCENTTATAGGAEIESDDDLTYRTYMAPSGYSVAGPADAYIYHAKQCRADIGDVLVYSPSAGTVKVLFTLDDGSLPDSDELSEMETYLSGDIRPMTDSVSAAAPTEVSYNITMTYYINRAESGKAASIQQAVTSAVSAYQSWQRKIGRDISPSKLIQLVMDAGAKRVAVTAPAHTAIDATKIAKAGTVSVTYGGLEDD